MGLGRVSRRGPLRAAVAALPLAGAPGERDGALVRTPGRPGEPDVVLLVRVHEGRPHYLPVAPALRPPRTAG